MSRGPGEKADVEVQTEIVASGAQSVDIYSSSEEEEENVDPLAQQLEEVMGTSRVRGGDATDLAGSP